MRRIAGDGGSGEGSTAVEDAPVMTRLRYREPAQRPIAPSRSSRRFAPLLTMEVDDARSQVLVITNMWPDDEQPVYGIFVKRQMESLRAFGIHVDVAYIRGKRSPLAYPLAAASFALRSPKLARRYRLVHVHAGETGLAARLVRGVPMLISYCGDDLLGDPRADGRLKPKSVLRSIVLRQLARTFSATITKSREMEDALPGPVADRNVVLPNGVDTDLFRPIDKADCRGQLGWDADERVALFVGNPDIERKRYWLAEAAREAAERDVGPIRLHVAKSVTPDHVPVLMNAADVLLFPSSLEGSPNTVKEALMCDLPVIASAVGDIPELLEGVEPSWLCEPTPEAYCAALTDALREPRRSNGRASAEHLSSRAIAARLFELYTRLAPSLAELPPRTTGGVDR
jgi:glycosyltransferase involved in cell wall biosynthesis